MDDSAATAAGIDFQARRLVGLHSAATHAPLELPRRLLAFGGRPTLDDRLVFARLERAQHGDAPGARGERERLSERSQPQ